MPKQAGELLKELVPLKYSSVAPPQLTVIVQYTHPRKWHQRLDGAFSLIVSC